MSRRIHRLAIFSIHIFWMPERQKNAYGYTACPRAGDGRKQQDIPLRRSKGFTGLPQMVDGREPFFLSLKSPAPVRGIHAPAGSRPAFEARLHNAPKVKTARLITGRADSLG